MLLDACYGQVLLDRRIPAVVLDTAYGRQALEDGQTR